MGFPNNKIDLTGQIFERLTVLKEVGKDKHKRILWECICSCDNKTILANTGELRIGDKKSCGCIRREYEDKGKAYTSHILYNTWRLMNRRCYETTFESAYKKYGAKGVTVCNEWRMEVGNEEHNRKTFSNFTQWAKDYSNWDPSWPKSTYTIERINIYKEKGDISYCPSNCTWIPPGDQAKNRKTTHWVKFPDGALRTLKDAVKFCGMVDRNTALKRIKKGWSDYDAVSKPRLRSNASKKIGEY